MNQRTIEELKEISDGCRKIIEMTANNYKNTRFTIKSREDYLNVSWAFLRKWEKGVGL